MRWLSHRKFWLWMLIPLTLATAAGIYFLWPTKRLPSTFSISRETTFITEPLDANGHPNYLVALNLRLSEGVTPDDNAQVLIVRALGPNPGRKPLPEDYFRRLGMEPLPSEGNYFVSWEKYCQPLLDSIAKGDQADRADKLLHLQRRARWYSWDRKEFPEIVDWLRMNEKPLALLAEAVRRPKCFSPFLNKFVMNGFPQLSLVMSPTLVPCCDVAEAWATRAMGRIAEKDWEGAWQDFQNCRRLGRHLTHCGQSYGQLYGGLTEQVGLEGQFYLLNSARVDGATFLRWLDDCRSLPRASDTADALDLGDRFQVLERIVNTAITGRSNLLDDRAKSNWEKLEKDMRKLDIDFDASLRVVNAAYDREGEIYRIPSYRERKQRLDDFAREWKGEQTKSIPSGTLQRMTAQQRGEGFGIQHVARSHSWTSFNNEFSPRVQQKSNQIEIALALARYHVENAGRYPPQLADLTPKYLKSIPNDVFTDQPPRYRLTKDGYLLYSLGQNMIDDDDQKDEPDYKKDDIRVQMPTTKSPSFIELGHWLKWSELYDY